MNKLLTIFILIAILILGFYAFNSYIYNEKQGDPANTDEPTDRMITDTRNINETDNIDPESLPVQVIPITHASAILQWEDAVIYTDPTGLVQTYTRQPPADIILITDIHGDHLDANILEAVIGDAVLIAPQAVVNLLPDGLKGRALVLANGETTTQLDFDITAVPMYNLPESADSRHPKGRGNGYLIERDGFRVYIAGDTAGITEMRSLTDVDIAFVPMNPPFTMTVEEAADAVLDFKPRQVYPFHYRGQNGLSDTNKFKELVNAGDSDIEVVLLNWYPQENQ